MPKPIMFPALPSIDTSKEDMIKLGPVAVKALKKTFYKGWSRSKFWNI